MKLPRLACCVITLVSATLFAQTVRQPLIPASAKPGSKGFSLTVNGTAFHSGAVVQWNGSPRLTERISSRQLKATIKASDVAKAGTAWVTVVNGGGVASNVVFFRSASRLRSWPLPSDKSFPAVPRSRSAISIMMDSSTSRGVDPAACLMCRWATGKVDFRPRFRTATMVARL